MGKLLTILSSGGALEALLIIVIVLCVIALGVLVYLVIKGYLDKKKKEGQNQQAFGAPGAPQVYQGPFQAPQNGVQPIPQKQDGPMVVKIDTTQVNNMINNFLEKLADDLIAEEEQSKVTYVQVPAPQNIVIQQPVGVSTENVAVSPSEVKTVRIEDVDPNYQANVRKAEDAPPQVNVANAYNTEMAQPTVEKVSYVENRVVNNASEVNNDEPRAYSHVTALEEQIEQLNQQISDMKASAEEDAQKAEAEKEEALRAAKEEAYLALQEEQRQKELAEKEKQEALKAEKQAKPKTIVYPLPVDLAKKAMKDYPDVEIRYGKDDENFKIYRGKTLLLICQRTNNDYRITFQRKPISATKILIKYPNNCVKASTPEGEQWFKFTNNGKVEEEDVYQLIDYSYKYVIDAENKAIAKKEAQKARIKARKQAIKDKEKAKIAEAKAKEKAKQDAIKAEEKAKQDAIKAEEKAKQDAIKAEERARIAEQKAKEKAEADRIKAEEKAKADAEKAKAKEEALKKKAIEDALKQKEREKAKAEALKEKEKAKAEIQKAQEKAKAEAQKQKEKEKAEALKQKEKEKQALLKQKEKEKAKAEAEKAKAKAKADAEKAKAKAKADEEKAKAKAKAKEEAEKAKAEAKAKADEEKAKAKAEAKAKADEEKAKAKAEAKAKADEEKAKAKAKAEEKLDENKEDK